MFRSQRVSLRIQLVALVLVAVAPAIALSVYTGQEQRRIVETDAREHVQALAQIAAEALGPGTEPAASTRQRSASVAGLPPESMLLVLPSDGTVLGRAANQVQTRHPNSRPSRP